MSPVLWVRGKGRAYGDFRHRRCYAQESSLQTLVADDQLTVLQVQTVQKRVQSHLRGGDVEFRQRLRQGDVVEGEVNLLLTRGEEAGATTGGRTRLRSG